MDMGKWKMGVFLKMKNGSVSGTSSISGNSRPIKSGLKPEVGTRSSVTHFEGLMSTK